MLSFSAKPLRVVAYQNLLPSCLDLGSCTSLLEIFNAPRRSKVRTLSWLVFSNASNLQLRNCGHSLLEALSASCKLSLVPSGLFRDVSRRHACWTVSCDKAGTWPNWCIRKKYESCPLWVLHDLAIPNWCVRIFELISHFIIDVLTFRGPIILQSPESLLASFQQTLRLPYLEVTAGGLFLDSVPTDQGDVAWLVRCAKQCEVVFLVPDGFLRSHGSYSLKILD